MLISLEEAKAHLRAVGIDEDMDIESKLDAAIEYAVEFMNCNLYESQEELQEAVAAAPQAIVDARTAYSTALAMLNTMENRFDAEMMLELTNTALTRSIAALRMSSNGRVINSCIKAGILMILGHLCDNRAAVEVTNGQAVEIPMGAQSFLWPYRCGLGV